VSRAQDHQFEFDRKSGFARRFRCPYGRELPLPDPAVEAQERYSQAAPLLLTLPASPTGRLAKRLTDPVQEGERAFLEQNGGLLAVVVQTRVGEQVARTRVEEQLCGWSLLNERLG
jgi:hypothetical protein